MKYLPTYVPVDRMIVVNELSRKCNTLLFDEIVKICQKFYTYDEVDCACELYCIQKANKVIALIKTPFCVPVFILIRTDRPFQ